MFKCVVASHEKHGMNRWDGRTWEESEGRLGWLGTQTLGSVMPSLNGELRVKEKKRGKEEATMDKTRDSPALERQKEGATGDNGTSKGQAAPGAPAGTSRKAPFFYDNPGGLATAIAPH